MIFAFIIIFRSATDRHSKREVVFLYSLPLGQLINIQFQKKKMVRVDLR